MDDGAIVPAVMRKGSHKLREDAVIRALRANHGLVTQTATALGVSRNGLLKFLRKRPHLLVIKEEQTEVLLDVAESNLVNGLYAGDDRYTRWFLSNKGKHRGYSTRQEVSGPNGDPVPFTMIERVRPTIDLDAEEVDAD